MISTRSRKRPEVSSILSKYLADNPVLSREEQNELFKQWHENKDESARTKLIETNLRFVLTQAYSFKNYRHVNFEDLVQAGVEGFIRSLEKFDPSRGNKLITYSIWWIKAYMRTLIIKESGTIQRFSTTTKARKLFWKIGAINEVEFLPQEEREQAYKDLAETCQVDLKDILDTRDKINTPQLSLDIAIHNEGNVLTYKDFLLTEEATQEQKAIDNSVAAVLDQHLSKLDKRQRDVLTRRYLNIETETLQTIGKSYGISRERVRQIETKALNLLRESIEADEGRQSVAS